MIESKLIAVILFGFGTFFLLCGGLIILSGVKKIDKEDMVLFGVALLIISLVLGYSLIIGGIQLWQI